MTIRRIMGFLMTGFLMMPLPCLPTLASDVPGELEADYARAVIDFNSGRFAESVSRLDSILSRAPQASEALELRALAQKASRRDEDALSTYDQLARAGPVERKARYYYEMATILYRLKRFAQARIHFEAAIRGDFNASASLYFLGLMDFEEKQLEPAEIHLRKAVGGLSDDIKPLAYYHLGVIYYRTGYPMDAVRSLKAARELAEAWKGSPDEESRKSGEQISQTAGKLLKTMDRGRWFGNAGVSTQYDSNVTLLPDYITGGNATLGKRTLKEIFTGGAGYMTSPARVFQAVASYRGFFNYNFNSDAKELDFLSSIPSAYLSYKPYARFAPGLKAEGNYTFQNQAPRGSLMELHPYSLTGDLGGFTRYEIDPKLFVEADLSYRPKKYYGDADRGPDRRSGGGTFARLAGDYASPWKLLHPGAQLTYERDATDGANWSYGAFGFGLSDLMKFNPRDTASASLDVSFPRYTDRFPQRLETLVVARALWTRNLEAHWVLISDLAFEWNHSNLGSLFTYTRYMAGVGVSYVF